MVYMTNIGDNRLVAAPTIFLNIGIALLSARLFVEIARRIKIPPVMGELLAGVEHGPSLPGWIKPDEVLQLQAQIVIIFLCLKIS